MQKSEVLQIGWVVLQRLSIFQHSVSVVKTRPFHVVIWGIEFSTFYFVLTNSLGWGVSRLRAVHF